MIAIRKRDKKPRRITPTSIQPTSNAAQFSASSESWRSHPAFLDEATVLDSPAPLSEERRLLQQQRMKTERSTRKPHSLSEKHIPLSLQNAALESNQAYSCRRDQHLQKKKSSPRSSTIMDGDSANISSSDSILSTRMRTGKPLPKFIASSVLGSAPTGPNECPVLISPAVYTKQLSKSRSDLLETLAELYAKLIKGV